MPCTSSLQTHFVKHFCCTGDIGMLGWPKQKMAEWPIGHDISISFTACHYVTPIVQYWHMLWCYAICHLPLNFGPRFWNWLDNMLEIVIQTLSHLQLSLVHESDKFKVHSYLALSPGPLHWLLGRRKVAWKPLFCDVILLYRNGASTVDCIRLNINRRQCAQPS